MHRTVEAARVLNSTLDLAELTRIILRIVRDEVGVDRVTVFVVERDRKNLRSLVAQEVESEIVVPMGVGIAGAVAAQGEIIDIRDVYADERFDRSIDSSLGYRTNDIYCLPIVNREGSIVGALELINRRRAFDDDDVEFLSAISVHIGIALENARLHLEIIEKKRIEQELNLARDIQANFLPRFPERYSEAEIAGSTDMCYEVGGDYCSFFAIDSDRFVVMIGDVSGKGIGAALVMTSLQATCRALIRQENDLARMVETLSEMVRETTRGRTYATLLVMSINTSSRTVRYIRAGHNPPVLAEPDSPARTLELTGGLPIGLLPDARYETGQFQFAPGSWLVVYTDGLTEAEDGNGLPWGEKRLCAVVEASRRRSAREVHDEILRSLREFVGGLPLQDDCTLMVLRFGTP